MADLKTVMSDPKNKNMMLVIGLAIIIVAVIVIAAVAKNRPEQKIAEEQNEPTATSTENTTVATSSEETVTPPSKIPAKKPAAKATTKPTETNTDSEEVAIGVNIKANDAQYRNALAAYGGYRIQIEDCQPTPTKLTVKDGRNILLDGFSPDKQTIIIGTKKIVLNGYDAQVVRIDGAPQSTLSIDCERNGVPQYNIGEILVMP